MDLSTVLERLDAVTTHRAVGRVRSAIGTSVRVSLPGASIGEMAEITCRDGRRLLAEVAGFDGDDIVLMPLGSLRGVQAGGRVELCGQSLSVQSAPSLRGRVLDPLGRPLDGRPLPEDARRWSVQREAPAPLERQRIRRQLVTGVRAIDGLLTLGLGQRVGLFAEAGAGKSTLLGLLARRAEVDAVVVALVGERGREVRAFLEDALGEAGLARSVVVVAPSDAPALARVSCARVATAIAENFRDQHGMDVLLLVDSMTRVARAQREVGLASGEPPVRRGYPPSLSGVLARLVERAGNSARGCMSAVYAVLTTAGERLEDPVADELTGLLDGHLVLSRELAARGHFPALDVLGSLSRLMPELVDEEHLEMATRLRRLMAARASRRELIELGAYRRGSDPDVDEALEIWPEVLTFLRQRRGERSSTAATLEALFDLVA